MRTKRIDALHQQLAETIAALIEHPDVSDAVLMRCCEFQNHIEADAKGVQPVPEIKHVSGAYVLNVLPAQIQLAHQRTLG